MSAIVKIPYDAIDIELTSPPYNAQLDQLVLQAVKMGAIADLRNGGDTAHYQINNTDKIKIAHCSLVLSVGGDVEGMPLYIAVDDMDAETPVGLLNSVKEGGGQKTWNEWLHSSHTATQGTDNKYYFSAAASDLKNPKFSDLQVVLSDLKTAEEYKAAMPSS